MQDFASFIDNVGLTLDSNGSNIFNFPYASDMELSTHNLMRNPVVPQGNSAPVVESGTNHPGLKLLRLVSR
jgi:hypothetical protein